MDQQMMHGGLEDDNLDELDTNGLIGVIKIKDGLFICDELGAQVRNSYPLLSFSIPAFFQLIPTPRLLSPGQSLFI